MNISILSLLLILLLPDPQTPNYYPGLVSAREASKKSKKEMVILFSDKSCTDCEAAWMAFTKDAMATNQYISTRMNVNDFDGGIFFDLLGMEEVPSWIILYPDGTEKERWEGGWKDASGKPMAYDKSVLSANQPQNKTKNEAAIHAPTTKPIEKNKTSEPASKITTNASPSTGSSTTGFYLQAGYFGSEINAQKMIADLKTKGSSGFEIKIDQKDGATFYRVISKIYSAESGALAEQQKLAAAGIKASIKPQPLP